MRRASAIALILGSITLTATPGASIAAPPVPEDFSAADQYVESLPTSRGSKPARGGNTPALDTSARVDGSGARQFEQIATSPDLGAPQKKLRGARRAEKPSVPSAVVNAIDEGEGGGAARLLLWLALVSGVVAGIAGHRHYRSRQADRKT